MKQLTRAIVATLSLPLIACGGGETLPQLTAAKPEALKVCESLLSTFAYSNTAVTAATAIESGKLSVAANFKPIGEHCLVTGRMHSRVSPVDGQPYAIGFEMRLPKNWNGRFLYQGNGGTDGVVAVANGLPHGPGQLTNALYEGFAVISSDAGHSQSQVKFGLDPQARLDYGYQAVAKLTPMAKAMIRAAYGKEPDRSYIVGTSNGGRHVMVSAARTPDQYDGYLASAPGFNLPKAAVAQLWGAQQWAPLATQPVTPTNLGTALTAAERTLVASSILGKCDTLDGLADGMIQDVDACQGAFNPDRDVPTCVSARDGTCLTPAQKTALAKVYAGARNSKGEALYARFPFDTGIASSDWAAWKFVNSVGATRDPIAVGYIFSSPPQTNIPDTLAYALNFNVDTDALLIFATSGVYAESAMSFMSPPAPTGLDSLRNRGAKMMVLHGVSDPVFSAEDTRRWYDDVQSRYGGRAQEFVRFFRVPGMTHSRNGPSADQYDTLAALVQWVEQGTPPDRVVASVRGADNVAPNTELKTAALPWTQAWSGTRTRPLCPYPAVARYIGTGDTERAESFVCRN
ncbi:MAG TPA: tannase/feruloyl esterase family alpha/beta hydrolase [Burkholderiaceae bacterium]|nr:tannase/feruloyl esterase family alpha/beta hydrolase [Burkholderiaceae bacterium]